VENRARHNSGTDRALFLGHAGIAPTHQSRRFYGARPPTAKRRVSAGVSRIRPRVSFGRRASYLQSSVSGRTLSIDDLVTHDSDRSRGFGAALFDWLVEHARENGCEYLTLDSGVQRFAAHRFYLKRGMDITSHHFQLKLNS